MASNVTEWNSVTVDNDGHDLRFSLTIRNFMDHVSELGERLDTPDMECTQRCGTKWVLFVYTHGETEKSKDDFSVYLRLVDKPAHAKFVTSTCHVYILGKGGNKLVSGPLNLAEKNFRVGLGFAIITRSEIAENKELYLPDGHLTIRCEGKEFLNKPHRTLKIENIPQVVVSNSPSKVLKELYQDGICSDVVLKTGSSEVKCHKAILAVSSNYCKAMFGHDMKENRENVVDVGKDLNEEELKAMLDFIYLGTPDFANLSLVSAQTLYRVSDMYEIDGLQAVCETELMKKLNQDNVNEVMVFAIEFGANRLKKAAAAIITQDRA